jgi:hypothetical protein
MSNIAQDPSEQLCKIVSDAIIPIVAGDLWSSIHLASVVKDVFRKLNEAGFVIVPADTPPAMNWKQFSLYPPGCRNKFQPLQVLHQFLPRYLNTVALRRWHVLFEPSALVRIIADDFDFALGAARGIAADVGLEFVLGDCSADHCDTLPWPGEDFYGKELGYSDELWTALATYLQACSELSLVVSKEPQPEMQLKFTRKALHLCLNTLGLNYLEEATVCRHHADVCVDLMKRFYRM